MDLFFFIFIAFTIFVICSLCGFCCRSKEQGAIYSTPVVVTSETHQAPGSNYAVSVEQTTTVQQTMPYPTNFQTGGYPPSQPYPPTGSPYPPYPSQPMAPYPDQNAAPYPTQPVAPYPNQNAPYPSQNAPYPTQNTTYPGYPPQTMMNPPSYSEVVTNTGFQKQAPYNPAYPGGN